MDVNNEDVADNFLATVWEPAVIKKNALIAASEAACLILSVDETVTNKKSQVVSLASIFLLMLIINGRLVLRLNMVATPACNSLAAAAAEECPEGN